MIEAFAKIERFAEMAKVEQENAREWPVQYLPCGHIEVFRQDDLLRVAPSVERQLHECKNGKKLDAPIRPSSECPACALGRIRDQQLFHWD